MAKLTPRRSPGEVLIAIDPPAQLQALRDDAGVPRSPGQDRPTG
ncbi:MAG: hypothetical protein U5K30_15160 [Acidimicrobiales bacterium]|nr:hypothetical protein [Acidimicrobiales bacterium]